MPPRKQAESVSRGACLDAFSDGNYHEIRFNPYVKRAQILFAFRASPFPVSFLTHHRFSP